MLWRRLYLVPVVATLLLAAALGILQPGILDDLGTFVFDSWQRLKPRAFDPDAAVRVVVVDEASLATFGQWPWPRTRLAEATRKLGELGAAAVAFDIVFAETDRTSLEAIVASLPAGVTHDLLAARLPNLRTNDQLFVDAMKSANVVLGTTMLATGPPIDLTPKAAFVFAGDAPEPFVVRFRSAAVPLPIFLAQAKGLGATNWLPDRDQVVRRVPLLVRRGDVLLPALSLEALRVAQGASTIIVRASNASGEGAFGASSGINALKVGDLAIDTGPNADIRPYYTKTNPARFIPVGRLLQGKLDRSEVEGRIILVGTTAIGLGDVRATPLDAAVSGVEIQAQIIEALMSGATLARPDWASGAEVALALLLGILVAAALPKIPPLAAATAVVAAIAVCGGGSFLAFARGHLLLDPSLPSLTVGSVYLAGTLALWRADRLAKQRVRTAFGKYLAPTVVDRLAEDPRGLVLGGETRRVTVMFSDIRDFTGLSEGLGPQELTGFMNAYLTPMTDAILDREGTIDKYIGDAIVAFWNAPLDVAAHEARAVDAALEMRAALAALNAAQRDPGSETGGLPPVLMGIGLNVGPCTVGNLGSLRRFDYSILGDAANLAARLENVAKLYRLDIVASQAVVDAAPAFAWLEVDQVKVKGRKEATRIFTVAGDAACADTADFAAWRQAHVAMLDTYREGDFEAAIAAADRLQAHAVPPWPDFYRALSEWFRHVAAATHRSTLFPIRSLDSK